MQTSTWRIQMLPLMHYSFDSNQMEKIPSPMLSQTVTDILSFVADNFNQSLYQPKVNQRNLLSRLSRYD